MDDDHHSSSVAGSDGSPRSSGNLRLRMISSMVLLPGAAALIAIGGQVFAVAVIAIALLMAWEWGGLAFERAQHNRARALLLTGSLAVLGVAVIAGATAALIALTIVVPLIVAGGLVLSLARIVWLVIAILGTMLPAVALIWMRGIDPFGLETALYVITSVVAVDIGAFAAGRMIGGPKLMPRISPAKTWAGLIGGIVSAMVFAAIVALSAPGSRWEVLVPLAVAIALVSQMGDLLESSVKRHFNVKDSGHLIPGHGGVLDRLDGQATVIPVMALAMALSGRSVLLW